MTNNEGSQFPKVYSKCPRCGCEKTICQEAWREEVKEGHISQESKDVPVALDRMGTPLTDPRRGVGLSVRVLLISYDVCWKCGLRYAVRAEKQIAPVQMQPRGNTNPPYGMPPGMGRR